MYHGTRIWLQFDCDLVYINKHIWNVCADMARSSDD